MKNDGFTLVELLAVIVVLGLIALITTISTSTTINNSKTKLSEIQTKKIEKAAEMYYLKEGINENNYDYEETKTCVNVEYLIENDYIEENELINPKDNNKMLGSVKIRYESGIYTYNYKDTECNSSDYDSILKSICKPVTEKTKTTGNVPAGDYLPGDEYICEVKPDTKYRFFVLSTNNKAGEIITDDSADKDIVSVNLIMDRNMYYDATNDVGNVAIEKNKGKVEWSSGLNYVGPVTALQYLHDATKKWIKIPDIIMNYEDETYDPSSGYSSTGYKKILTTGNETAIISSSDEKTLKIKNLKARLPMANEIVYNCEYEEINDYGDIGCIGCSMWLGTHLINYYWTLSPGSHGDDYAYAVGTYGISNLYTNDSVGVRPVITIEI